MRFHPVWLGAALFSLAAGPVVAHCTPPVPPAPIPVITDAGGTASEACAHLTELGCKDGIEPNCTNVLNHVLSTGLTLTGPIGEAPFACVLAAHDQVSVRRCAPLWRSACGGSP